MKIPPKYKLTAEISHLLEEIEFCKSVIASTDLPIKIEQNLRRQSVLKSSLYSAKIEGNELLMKDLSSMSSKDLEKVEVFNILKAINHISNEQSSKTNLKTFLDIHKILLSGLSNDFGHFRTEMNAIFDASGSVVYLPPPPNLVKPLLEDLIEYIDSSSEKIIPIKACIAHYIFEKIHPFIDGNGRVGRILIQKILYQHDYWMKGLLSIEEYLNENRQNYYMALEESESDISAYVTFMLKALASTSKKAKDLILIKSKYHDETDNLLPRRMEILNIIKDHQFVSFDTIRRRFDGINERTLRYDLKKLQDENFITKLGVTKGVYYRVNE